MPGEIVTFPSNGSTAQGYLSLPPAGRGPGLVVIQEWWGLVDHIKDVADRFAAQGFVALAPDLYHGTVTAEPDEAAKLMMAMEMDRAAKDMSGAYEYLKANDASTGKVGCIGFCLGGGLSLFLSTLRPMDATVVYYGVLPGAQPDLSKLEGPVLGHYAEHDDFASPDSVRALEQELRGLGKEVEFHIHPGTSHAFFNDTGGNYNAVAAGESWERTLAFLREHLG